MRDNTVRPSTHLRRPLSPHDIIASGQISAAIQSVAITIATAIASYFGYNLIEIWSDSKFGSTTVRFQLEFDVIATGNTVAIGGYNSVGF